MLKEVKEAMDKEMEETRKTMCKQNEKINKEIEIIKTSRHSRAEKNNS